jgi:hypothetical protein
MTLPLGPLTISPTTPYHMTIPNPGLVQQVKFTNGTQFDITATGYGMSGQTTIPAGMEYMLYGSDNQQGFINFTATDNLNVGGQGVLNATGYLVGEQMPQGSWPVAIPAQRVIASSFAGQVIATNLVNVGNALTQNVIQVQPAGDSGNTFSVDNAGNVTIGDALHGGGLSVVGNIIVGGNVAGNGTQNLKLDSNGTSRAIQFDVNNVQKAFVDNTGLVMNTPITNATGGITNPTWTGGMNLSGGLYIHDSAINGDSNSPNINFQTASGAGHVLQFLTNAVLRMSIQDTQVQIVNSDLNALQKIIAGDQIQPNDAVFSTVNGSVSGVADLWCPIWGSALKMGWVNLRNNFNTAAAVTLLFPTPQMNFAWYVSGDISGTTWQANLGGSAAAMRHTLTIGGAAAAGTSESVPNIKALNFGQFLGSDRVVINTTAGGNINSFFWFIGQ